MSQIPALEMSRSPANENAPPADHESVRVVEEMSELVLHRGEDLGALVGILIEQAREAQDRLQVRVVDVSPSAEGVNPVGSVVRFVC